jgi:hypothetical protein
MYVSAAKNLFACLFVAAEKYFYRCLATAISHGSIIPAFIRHVSLHLEVVANMYQFYFFMYVDIMVI